MKRVEDLQDHEKSELLKIIAKLQDVVDQEIQFWKGAWLANHKAMHEYSDDDSRLRVSEKTTSKSISQSTPSDALKKLRYALLWNPEAIEALKEQCDAEAKAEADAYFTKVGQRDLECPLTERVGERQA